MDAETKLEDFKVTLFMRLWDAHTTSFKHKFKGSTGYRASELKLLVQELGLTDEAIIFAKQNFTQAELDRWKMNKWEIQH